MLLVRTTVLTLRVSEGTMDTKFHFRLDESIKIRAQKAAEARGKTLSEACRDFAEQLAREVEPLSQHEKWLKKQVEMSVAKVNAGEAKFTSNEEVKRVVASRKDEIRAKYKR